MNKVINLYYVHLWFALFKVPSQNVAKYFSYLYQTSLYFGERQNGSPPALACYGESSRRLIFAVISCNTFLSYNSLKDCRF